MNTNTYTVTTRAGKTYTVESALTDREAAELILSKEGQSDFARDIARKALEALTNIVAFPLSPKQRAWLHVLAGWASKPARSEASSDSFPAILGLLERASEAQKRQPFIALELDGAEVLIRRAPKGHANVTSGGPFETRTWFGRINLDGSFFRSRACTDEIVGLLRKVEEDPARVASQHGVATGYCCFCARDLSTKESRSVGYGPVCAEKFGLPWGEIDPDLDAEGREKFSA